MKIKRIFITFCFLFISIINLQAQSSRGMEGELKVLDNNGAVVNTFTQGYALVIGEINYKYWDQLKSVREDVTAVTKLFEEQKFIVEPLVDKNGDELKRGIENFLNRYGHEKNARLIVYFAGHGATYTLNTGKKMGYIVPIDAPLFENDSISFLQKSIPMNQFETWSTQYACRHILFIFDSCFSGTIFTTRGAEELPAYISKSLAEPVRQFITSGNEKETVPEPSVFRPLLERGLRNGEADKNKDGYISGTELGEYLQREIKERSNGKYNPQFGKSNDINLDKGEFIFISGTSKNTVVILPPDDPVKNDEQGKTTNDKIDSKYFVGKWEAIVEYNNSFDTYQINLLANGNCTIKLINDNAEQETNGKWSWNGSLLKINAVFRNAKITYQRNIDWTSLVSFPGGNNSFYILAKPAANSSNIRFMFFRE
jgi:hypothetical protein